MEFHVLDTVHVGHLGRTGPERDVRHILDEGGLDLREAIRPDGRVTGAGFISDPLVDLGVVVERAFGLGPGDGKERRNVVVGVEVVRIPAEEEHWHLLLGPPRFVRGPNVGFESYLDLAA